jgi:hypothetical protein
LFFIFLLVYLVVQFISTFQSDLSLNTGMVIKLPLSKLAPVVSLAISMPPILTGRKKSWEDDKSWSSDGFFPVFCHFALRLLPPAV